MIVTGINSELLALKNYLKQQKKTIQDFIKNDESFDIDFKPITIIDNTASPNSIKNIGPEIQIVPEVIKIDKDKVFKRRVMIFALGAIQIIAGALIMYYSSIPGFTHTFAINMITSGIQDWISLFKSNQYFNDLRNYFSTKAIHYCSAIIFAGLTNKTDLIPAKGLELIKKAMPNKLPVVPKEVISTVFPVSTSSLYLLAQTPKEKIQPIKNQQTNNIIQNKNIKQTVCKFTEEEANLQKINKEVQQKFEKEAQRMIKQSVGEGFRRHASNLKQLSIQPLQVKFLVASSFKRVFGEEFKDHKCKFEQICLFLQQHLKSKTLAKDAIKHFKIQELITKSIKDLTTGEQFQKVIKFANQKIHNSIIQQINKIIEKYKGQYNQTLKKLQIQKEQIQNTPLVEKETKKRRQKYEADIATLQKQENLFNKFGEELRLICRDDMVDKFIRDKIISEGKINKNVLRQQNFHPYFKEALQSVPDFVPNEGDFLTQMEVKVYNLFVSTVGRALIKVFDKSSNSRENLKKIKDQVCNEMLKK